MKLCRATKQCVGLTLLGGSLLGLMLAGFHIWEAMGILSWGMLVWIAIDVDDIKNRQKAQNAIFIQNNQLLNDIADLLGKDEM